VLKKLAAQLGRDASARFTFVSSHPAPELRELCDTARAAGGDPEAYKEESIRELVGKSRAIVVAMRKELGIEKLG